MSETVHYRGVLIEVEKLENETLEDQCKRLLDYKELPSYCKSYREMLLYDSNEGYIIYKNKLYMATTKDIDPYNDIFYANKNDDETIDFEVKYYNGGCGFSEAIEYALNNMKE